MNKPNPPKCRIIREGTVLNRKIKKEILIKMSIEENNLYK